MAGTMTALTTTSSSQPTPESSSWRCGCRWVQRRTGWGLSGEILDNTYSVSAEPLNMYVLVYYRMLTDTYSTFC